jgi:hypothetical protein
LIPEFSGKLSRCIEIQAKADCSRQLCWHFCWYRQAKRAAADFDIPDEEFSAGMPRSPLYA